VGVFRSPHGVVNLLDGLVEFVVGEIFGGGGRCDGDSYCGGHGPQFAHRWQQRCAGCGGVGELGDSVSGRCDHPVGDAAAGVETSLATRLGVSRTPIREALRRLEQDGLVERTSRGTRVVERSPEQILEIYELRILLEGQAARAAAERATSLDINRLRAIHEQMEAAGPDDDQHRVRLNRLFHEALWAASHNGTLVEVIDRLIAHLHPQTTLRFPGRWDSILREHGELLAAITEHRADDAAAIATEHMTQAREIRLQLYAGALGDSNLERGA